MTGAREEGEKTAVRSKTHLGKQSGEVLFSNGWGVKYVSTKICAHKGT